ncbi:MAG TPA: Gfo/Idh/MocA family oxidoreductase [Roseiflexaceae bacterium]|nr:Gfo/Idh/MocA family oxidoreductase [Roseiflexaceae bacterium]
MAGSTPLAELRIGMLGSGFIAHFHLQALVSVRNVRVSAVYSPTPANREALAARANELELGPCTAYDSLEALLTSGEVDALWILGPNDTRVETMRTINEYVKQGRTSLRGIACEKPLARTLGEAQEMLRLVEDAGLSHGYLENQVFSTAVRRGKDIIWRRGAATTGRPYLARASEEHSGPHKPWFWLGEKQGGGVLSDMMCHSVEVARFLLTDPAKDRTSLKLVSASATIATLKWSRPEYVERLRQMMGPEVDYATRPAEDFARGTLVLEDEAGHKLMIECSTSWAYVGPGLRIQIELLGPEYAMEVNTLGTELKVFLSRNVQGSQGEDLVEKQNAEQGLMPVLEDEAGIYGYTDENRHMVEAFRKGLQPSETFHDGVAVIEMLMALYRSADTGQTVYLADTDLTDYVPAVARGEFRG